MSFTSKGTAEIIVAGLQDKMLVIDLNKGEVVKQVSDFAACFPTRLTAGSFRYPLNTSTPS